MKILLSSETYSIDPADLACLDSDIGAKNKLSGCKGGVVILIGNSGKGEVDVLIRGSHLVERAIQSGVKYIPARIAFQSGIGTMRSHCFKGEAVLLGLNGVLPNLTICPQI